MARRHLGYGTTNAQGIATLEYAPDDTPLSHSYTGVGAGKINIVAEVEGLTSEAYELEDCIYYDPATSDLNANYSFNSTYTDFAFDSNKYILKNKGSTNAAWCEVRGVTNSVKGKRVTFSAECVLNSNEIRLEYFENGSRKTTSAYTSSNGTLVLEDISVPANVSTAYFRIAFRTAVQDSQITFKNFKIIVS